MIESLSLPMLFDGPASYLIPSVVLGLVLSSQRRAWMPVRFLQFTGVLIHEVLHFVVGLVTMARPTSMSLIPRAEAGRLVLGTVGFVGLNWLNAWITALAPLLVLPMVYGLANWRLTHGIQHVQWWDMLIWLVLAPQWLNCWPSRADWKLVLISWPLIGLFVGAIVVWLWGRS